MSITNWFTTLFKRPSNPDVAPTVISHPTKVLPAPLSTMTLDPKNDGINFESLSIEFDKRVPHWMPISLHPQTSNKERLEKWLASVSTSGFVREEALSYLISNYQSGDENRILLRLSDWVAPIRMLAENWTLENFSKLPLESIQKNQSLILYLSRKEFLQTNPAYLAILNNLLMRTENLAHPFFKIFNSPFRRYLYLASLKRLGGLRNQIVKDPQLSSRTLLLTTPGVELSEQERNTYAKDKSALTAKLYLRWRIARNENVKLTELQALALHSSKGAREFARFYLDKLFKFDTYSFYKSRTDGSFFYICDFAKIEDFKYFFSALNHTITSIRLMGLRAMLACDPNAIEKINVSDLISQSGKIRSLLSPYLHLLSDDELLGMIPNFATPNGYGQLGFLAILEARSKWLCLSQILTIVTGADNSNLAIFPRLLSKSLAIGISLSESLTQARKDHVECALAVSKGAINPYALGIIKEIEHLYQTQTIQK